MNEPAQYLLAAGYLLPRLILGAVLVLVVGATINVFKR